MSSIRYSNGLIYFWSGTGNSYRVADWIGKTAGEYGVKTKVLSIDKNIPRDEIDERDDSFCAIVFPTHGFTAPWHIMKFAGRLPRGHSAHAYCIATRAGLKFGRIFIPGIGGSATFIIALILALKGYAVRGCMSVDMPSNWYSLHPIQNRKNHEAIIGRARKKVARCTERILSTGNAWLTVNNLFEIMWGILLSLISAGYLFMGRFFLAKLFFANDKCD